MTQLAERFSRTDDPPKRKLDRSTHRHSRKVLNTHKKFLAFSQISMSIFKLVFYKLRILQPTGMNFYYWSEKWKKKLLHKCILHKLCLSIKRFKMKLFWTVPIKNWIWLVYRKPWYVKSSDIDQLNEISRVMSKIS